MNHENPLADLNRFANFNQLVIETSRIISEAGAVRNYYENVAWLFPFADLSKRTCTNYSKARLEKAWILLITATFTQ
jgi:hypothetical protein